MRRLILAFLLLILCAGAQATTRTAASCSGADVQTTITASSNGDTVLVPGGICTWDTGTNKVTISGSQQITLNGQGTTTINFSGSGTDPGFGVTILNITTGTSNNTRLTGFTFNGAFTNGRSPITINSSSSSQTWRVDHNSFSYTSGGAGTFVDIIGDGPGLVDHNSASTTVNFTEMFHNFGSNSQTATWSSDVVPGSSNAVYFEDNTFTGPSSPGGFTQAVENFQGAKVVFRHNTMNNTGFDAHGGTTPTGLDCAGVNTRWYEVYSNTWTTTVFDAPTINVRGGSGVIWGNTHPSASAKIQLQADCLSDSSGVPYPYQDQDGRGITTSSGSSTTFSSPIYVWGNNAFSIGTISHNSSATTYIQLNRDYFTSASQPSAITRCESAADVTAGCPVSYAYAPFTYPYPLTGAGPSLVFSPNAASFGNQNVNTASSPITVTVSNVGGAPEVYSSLALSPSVFANGNTGLAGQCPASGTIAASASCTVKVTFTPTAATSYTGSITLTGTVNASGSLTGTGTNAISIPAVPTGLTVTLSAGNVATLNWTASTGTPTGYNCLISLTSGGPYTGFGPGASPVTNPPCSIGPLSTPGLHYFVVNAFNSAGTSANTPEVVVNIVGPAAAANLNPPSLFFGPVTLSTTSPALVSTLTNTGAATLSSITINAPSGPNAADFAQVNTCGATLAVNANCTISVTFTPSTTTPVIESAAIVVTSNASSSPDSVSLSGQGIIPLTVLPSSLNFGNVYANKTSAAQTVTFSNFSGATVTFSSIAVTGGDSTQFVKGTDTCGGSVANGASCTVAVTFQPTSTGGKSSTLVFTDSAAGSPHNVTLSGSGKNHKTLHVGVVI